MSEFKPLDLFDEGIETPIEKTQPAIDEKAPVEHPESDKSEEKETIPEKEADVVPAAPSTEELCESKESSVTENEGQSESNRALEQVLEATLRISEQLSTLTDTFNAKLMHSAHEEKIVDQMHKELQKYKEDMYAQLLRPILLDVIEVRDSIMRVGAVYRAKPEGEQNIPNKTFSDYAYDLQDILEKNNVEIYRSQTGDDFVPIKQRTVKKVATGDQTLHGKITESMSCGYSYNGRTISAEKVSIYYYEKPAENEEKSEVIDNG